MVYGKVVAGVALCTAITSSTALAQEARKLDFTAGVLVEYHSNVALTDETQAALRGLTQEDTIFTPSAAIDFYQPLGQQGVFLRGSVGYAFYENNDQLNREQLDLSGGFNGRAGPCAGTLTGDYSRGINRIDDPILIDAENVLEVKRATIEIGCARETGLGIMASASREWNENEEPLAKQSDSDRDIYMFGVSYSRPTLGTFTVFGSQEEVTYPNRLIDDGYDLNAIGVSYTRMLGARIQGDVSVAYTTVDLHAPALPGFSDDDFETTAYSGSLTYRASSRLNLQASFEKSVTPSSGFGRSYDVNEVYQLSGEYSIGSRIILAMGAARAEHDLQGGLALPTIQLTESTTDALHATMTYKLSEHLAFRLTAGTEERNTNAPQFDYTNNRVGVGVDAKF